MSFRLRPNLLRTQNQSAHAQETDGKVNMQREKKSHITWIGRKWIKRFPLCRSFTPFAPSSSIRSCTKERKKKQKQQQNHQVSRAYLFEHLVFFLSLFIARICILTLAWMYVSECSPFNIQHIYRINMVCLLDSSHDINCKFKELDWRDSLLHLSVKLKLMRMFLRLTSSWCIYKYKHK